MPTDFRDMCDFFPEIDLNEQLRNLIDCEWYSRSETARTAYIRKIAPMMGQKMANTGFTRICPE